MRWRNPEPPDDMIGPAHRLLSNTMIVTGVHFGVLGMGLPLALPIKCFFGLSATATLCVALWAERQERKALNDYVIRKHFS